MATNNSWNNRVTNANVLFTGGTFDVGTDATNNDINIGTNTNTLRIVTIGNTIGTSQTNINAANGGLNVIVGNSGNASYSIDNNYVLTTSVGTVSINAASTINIGDQATNANINIGTGGTRTCTIGSTTATSATTVACGTGGASFGASANSHTTTLGSSTGTSTTNMSAGTGGMSITTQGSGTLTINSVTGALSISNNANATTVNIATGAAAKTTTLGSTNTTSTTTIQSGSNPLTLTTNGGNANIVLTANGTGRVTTANNINAAGISFDSGTNTLNSYTRGNWTCTITGSGSNPTVTYTDNSGTYLKIGRLVWAEMFIRVNTISGGSGNVVLNGFPFTTSASSARAAVTVSGITFTGAPYIFMNSNATTAGVQFSTSGSTPTALAVSSLAASSYLQFTVIYEASS